jgi:hypothetical protein
VEFFFHQNVAKTESIVDVLHRRGNILTEQKGSTGRKGEFKPYPFNNMQSAFPLMYIVRENIGGLLLKKHKP